jgi:hypothetical protein
MRVVRVALFLLLFLSSALSVDAVDEPTPSPAGKAPCDCANFDSALAEAQHIYANREDDVALPLTPVMHDRYRARVDVAYARGECLANCTNVPEQARNRARVLLAEAGFKDASLGAAEWRARLVVVLANMTRCLEVEPQLRACHLWYAGSRGMLAKGSWNPLNLRLPSHLMDEFRLARGGTPAGHDFGDGPATRGEAAMLLRVPRFAGGDLAAGLALIKEAQRSGSFRCRVANRLLFAEALGRNGDLAAAHAEYRAIVADGLPDCSPQRYENAVSVEEAARCVARLDAAPGTDPGWDDDYRRP